MMPIDDAWAWAERRMLALLDRRILNGIDALNAEESTEIEALLVLLLRHRAASDAVRQARRASLRMRLHNRLSI